MSAELSQALRPVSSDSHPWVIASPATERHVSLFVILPDSRANLKSPIRSSVSCWLATFQKLGLKQSCWSSGLG